MWILWTYLIGAFVAFLFFAMFEEKSAPGPSDMQDCVFSAIIWPITVSYAAMVALGRKLGTRK